MSFYLQQNKDESKEFLADSFLQPVEHSFTVESLAALLESTGMEIIQPCIDVFDKVAGRLSWNLEFDDETAARNYDALDDLDRWKISNLLMVEKSLSLYFYAQRAESNFKRKSEQEICTDFLPTKRYRRFRLSVRHNTMDWEQGCEMVLKLFGEARNSTWLPSCAVRFKRVRRSRLMTFLRPAVAR